MEQREDLRSILPYLPLVIRSSSLLWPSQVVEALKAMSKGPLHSRVDSGEILFLAISDMRNSLSLSSDLLAPFTPQGYALFFDQIMSWEESTRWFGEVVPALANLLYRLPSLLEMHYQNADHLLGGGKHGINTGLRLLGPQEAGIVFLSQELIGALLACSFFCLFPVANRGAKHLPTINFDHLFATLYESCSGKQENKIKCIIHYFERISSCMPIGLVSFERKILPVELHSSCVVYPEADFWSRSVTPLSRFEVHDSGNIEDQLGEALEVDFANRYLGGGALHGGCVQEEIRFMINPELIAGMLCFPSMDDNEAIEIVGAERFSSYTGYASSFRFSGDYRDKRDVDYFGRRKTRIIAIDALCGPRMRQFEVRCLIREMNKAYCGFLHQSKCCRCERILGDNGCFESRLEQNNISYSQSAKDILLHEAPLSSADTGEGKSVNQESRNPNEKGCPCLDHEDNIGIVTGNWGCGAFGGDPELKAMIQWLAASQAVRPFISYYTFGMEALQDLDQVTKWVLHHEWTVGDLWNMLAEYSLQRLKGETNLGFFSWLLPWLAAGEGQMSNSLKLP